MNQLSRVSMKWSRLVGGIRHPSAAAVAPRRFSTEASEPSRADSGDQFFRTPSAGVVYGRLLDITKHTSKADVINLLDGSNLSPEKIKVEYNQGFLPLSMLVEFPSASSYDAALRSIGRKGRIYNIRRADKSDWDAGAPYDGKAIILLGLPEMQILMMLSVSFLVASTIRYNSDICQIYKRRPHQNGTCSFPIPSSGYARLYHQEQRLLSQ
ncbi:uncharacterized protein LOC125199397 [Salvia hispanica]|uniref:uncharacterized protein LOC125199397 n=1 Tax=Salvia hispanica TaxID=49212 RepID=UPI0020099454|nr:uncharacterized protein LOC125199397 [Salvia hispanica]